MPELPEVETVCRGLTPKIQGKTIRLAKTFRPDLRFPFPPEFCEHLLGQTIQRIHRRAKYILIDLDEFTLLIHLGMSGQIRIFDSPQSEFRKHDHVYIECDDGTCFTYHDPRRFGYMDLLYKDDPDYFRDTGVEPLEDAFDGKVFYKLLAKTQRPLKTALLDQKLVAGLGNIYVCEALWGAKLSPQMASAQITLHQAGALCKEIKAVLNNAITSGGSSLKDHIQVDGKLGYFQHQFGVYDRENLPCKNPGCQDTIRRLIQSGRSTFFCPSCQSEGEVHVRKAGSKRN